MTKQELISKVTRKTGYEETEVSAILHEVLNQIKANTKEGVYIRGFGSFTKVTRRAKIGRNITAGVPVFVPEHDIPVFKAAPNYHDQFKAGLPKSTHYGNRQRIESGFVTKS